MIKIRLISEAKINKDYANPDMDNAPDENDSEDAAQTDIRSNDVWFREFVRELWRLPKNYHRITEYFVDQLINNSNGSYNIGNAFSDNPSYFDRFFRDFISTKHHLLSLRSSVSSYMITYFIDNIINYDRSSSQADEIKYLLKHDKVKKALQGELDIKIPANVWIKIFILFYVSNRITRKNFLSLLHANDKLRLEFGIIIGSFYKSKYELFLRSFPRPSSGTILKDSEDHLTYNLKYLNKSYIDVSRNDLKAEPIFLKFKIVKTLGSGVFGTAYLLSSGWVVKFFQQMYNGDDINRAKRIHDMIYGQIENASLPEFKNEMPFFGYGQAGKYHYYFMPEIVPAEKGGVSVYPIQFLTLANNILFDQNIDREEKGFFKKLDMDVVKQIVFENGFKNNDSDRTAQENHNRDQIKFNIVKMLLSLKSLGYPVEKLDIHSENYGWLKHDPNTYVAFDI